MPEDPDRGHRGAGHTLMDALPERAVTDEGELSLIGDARPRIQERQNPLGGLETADEQEPYRPCS